MDPFHEHLLTLGLSPLTIRNYRQVVTRVQRWCAAQGHDLAALPVAVMADYAEHQPHSHASRIQLRVALEHWWRFAGAVDPPARVIRVPPRPRMQCRALDADDARILAKHARGRGDRAGLATCLGLYQALRRTEIATLRGDAVDGTWLTVTGKGSVTATIPLHPVVAELLNGSGRGWLFPGRFAGPVHPATIWDWIRRAGTDAGVPAFTPHQLRHTALATANDETGDLRSVQAFARHASPSTTAGYTRATTQRLRAVVAALDYD